MLEATEIRHPGCMALCVQAHLRVNLYRTEPHLGSMLIRQFDQLHDRFVLNQPVVRTFLFLNFNLHRPNRKDGTIAGGQCIHRFMLCPCGKS